MKLGVSPSVATHGDVCMMVAIRAGMTESIPSGLMGSSVSLVEGRAPRATDGSSLLSILHLEIGPHKAK